MKLLSCVRFFVTLWTVAHQAPLSMGFSRQEYWSGLPIPSPGNLPNPGLEPSSPTLQADTLTSEPSGKPKHLLICVSLIADVSVSKSNDKFWSPCIPLHSCWPSLVRYLQGLEPSQWGPKCLSTCLSQEFHLSWISFLPPSLCLESTRIFVVVQSLSCVWLFVIPWTAGRHAFYSSLSPGVCSNSCPLSCWCHPAISSSIILFSSCPQSFPASGSFPVSQLFASVGQSIGVSASVSVPPMNIQDWFPLVLTDLISLLSKGLSRVFSSTRIWQHQFFGVQPSLWSNSHMHTWLLEKP